MSKIILLAFVLFTTQVKAQTVLPGSLIGYNQRANFANDMHLDDSLSKKKWSFNRYIGLSTNFIFFKGGSAAIFEAPIGLQVNRRLNNNLYAFANVSVAPAYVSFNQPYYGTAGYKSNLNNSFNANSLNMYSSASLGLQYVNDAKTFSISGSISVERSNYPMAPVYPAVIETKPKAIPAY